MDLKEMTIEEMEERKSAIVAELDAERVIGRGPQPRPHVSPFSPRLPPPGQPHDALLPASAHEGTRPSRVLLIP